MAKGKTKKLRIATTHSNGNETTAGNQGQLSNLGTRDADQHHQSTSNSQNQGNTDASTHVSQHENGRVHDYIIQGINYFITLYQHVESFILRFISFYLNG